MSIQRHIENDMPLNLHVIAYFCQFLGFIWSNWCMIMNTIRNTVFAHIYYLCHKIARVYGEFWIRVLTRIGFPKKMRLISYTYLPDLAKNSCFDVLQYWFKIKRFIRMFYFNIEGDVVIFYHLMKSPALLWRLQHPMWNRFG